MKKVLKSNIEFNDVVVKNVTGTFVLDPSPANFTVEVPLEQSGDYTKMIDEVAKKYDIIMVHDENLDESDEQAGVFSFYVCDLDEKFISKLVPLEETKISIVCELVVSDYMGEKEVLLNVTELKA